MKDLYDITRHLVWLTQFGLSVCLPVVLLVMASVWVQKTFQLGGWIVVIGVVLGILGSVGSLRASLKAMDRQGKMPENKKPPVSFNRHG